MSLSGNFARKILIPFAAAIGGRRNLVRLGRLISMEARLDGANDMATNGETLVQEILLRNATGRPLTIFDIGANVGEWTLSLLEKAGTANVTVHLFEPASATYAELVKKLAAYKVRVENQAMSDKTGSAEFVIAGPGLGTNSLHGARSSAHSVETVRLNTVDAYCQEAGVTHIGLMKIDAEGHDMAVLEGARGMLTGKAIPLLQFEYNQRWIESRHFLKDAFELLLPLGYCVGKITPKGIEFYPEWHFELESFREGNYLACTPEWEARLPKVKWWNLD